MEGIFCNSFTTFFQLPLCVFFPQETILSTPLGTPEATPPPSPPPPKEPSPVKTPESSLSVTEIDGDADLRQQTAAGIKTGYQSRKVAKLITLISFVFKHGAF